VLDLLHHVLRASPWLRSRLNLFATPIDADAYRSNVFVVVNVERADVARDEVRTAFHQREEEVAKKDAEGNARPSSALGEPG
jgi:hypothetical protein